MEHNKPFDRDFVLKTTLKHMRRSIDISIRKTFERMEDLGEQGDKASEIMTTLSDLHNLRRGVDDIQKALFKKD